MPKFVHPADTNGDGFAEPGTPNEPGPDALFWLSAWREYKTHNTSSEPPSEIWKGTVDSDESGVVDESWDAGNPLMPNATNLDWNAYWNVVAQTATNPPLDQQLGNLPLYAGYWWDDAIGLYHVRHRVYRPEWGRWLQRDPLGYAPGWNLYQYVNGMPWGAVDPMGLIRDEFSTMGQGAQAARDAMAERGITGPIFPQVDIDDSLAQMDASGETGLAAAAGAMAGLVDSGLGILSSPFSMVAEIVEAAVDGGIGGAAMRVAEIPRDIKDGLVQIVRDAVHAFSGEDAYNNSLTTGQRIRRGVRAAINTVVIVEGIRGAGRGARGGAGNSSGACETPSTQISRPTKQVDFQGRRVWQRDDLINPDRIDEFGRTNIQRMNDGLAPIGPDGKSVHLHHIGQREGTPIMEMSRDRHLDTPHPERLSDVDHGSVWNAWRASYWKNRGRNWGRQ